MGKQGGKEESRGNKREAEVKGGSRGKKGKEREKELCKTLRKKTGEKIRKKITVRGKKSRLGWNILYTPVHWTLGSIDGALKLNTASTK